MQYCVVRMKNIPVFNRRLLVAGFSYLIAGQFCIGTVNLLILPLAAFLINLTAHMAALKFFPRLGLLDFPERYGLTRARIPYPTGMLSAATFLGLYPTIFLIGTHEWGVILAIILLGAVAFIDDRSPLPFSLRLSVQILIALLVFVAGSRIYTLTGPFGGYLKLDTLLLHLPLVGSLPVMSGIFTVLWLLLTINALNWFDGIPGQVSVLSAIGFLLLGCLTLLRAHQPQIALFCFVLAGIALAAVLFDFPPARMLMGDSGSMFFGLMLGLIGIYQGGKVATAFLVLGIPLIDAVFVVMRRLHRGSSPFKGGRDHLHHLLLQKGWSQRQVVVFTALVSAVFGTTALFLTTVGKAVEIAVLIVVMIIIHRYADAKR